MKFLDYLGITEPELQTYIDGGLVDVAHHDEFPLEMYTYGRKATYENAWDSVTRKCRGIIVNADTDEIVARPFEKFFNLGTAGMPETDLVNLPDARPEVFEKMDGFLCTMYEWAGQQYIASKGSFHSIHAKWATAWYLKNCAGLWPMGYTPVFEGICPSIRIVVDYEGFEGLVLLGLVHRETGDELTQGHNIEWARTNNCKLPQEFRLTADQAHKASFDLAIKNFEGYVLVYRQHDKPPLRVKVKYIDYLRIHRLVTCTTPKAIFERLSGEGWDGGVDALINDTTPWFNAYVAKWKSYLEDNYCIRFETATFAYNTVKGFALNAARGGDGDIWTRKQWATEFQRFDKADWPILFAMLDGKEVAPVIWKQIKPLMKNGKPLVDARFV